MSRQGSASWAVTATWAAAGKWAVRESGDAVSVVQLGPGRAVGFIVDVQGTGGGSGTTAWSLVALGTQLAADGVDAVALASILSRALWTRRGGRVQADLGVVIGDTGTGLTVATYGSVQLACTRCSDRRDGTLPSPAGLDRDAEPADFAVPLTAGPLAICSDGVASTTDELLFLSNHDPAMPPTASDILARAVVRDAGRPRNDMSVIVMSTSISEHVEPSVAGLLRVGNRPMIQRGEASRVHDPVG